MCRFIERQFAKSTKARDKRTRRQGNRIERETIRKVSLPKHPVEFEGKRVAMTVSAVVLRKFRVPPMSAACSHRALGKGRTRSQAKTNMNFLGKSTNKNFSEKTSPNSYNW